MTSYFVLDENIVICSAKVEDDQGNDDDTCSRLISDILHHKDVIRVNVELFENYVKALKSLESTVPSTAYTVKLLSLLRGSDSIHYWTSDLPELPNQELLPSDDVYIVKLAVGSNTDLISTDSPLEEKMKDAKIFENFNIVFLRPNEVYS